MKKIIIVGCLLAITNANAWHTADSMYCSEPYKPYSITTQLELDSYQRDVSDYKQCIETYIEEQNEAAEDHVKAAGDAADTWNSFVRYQ